MKLLMILFCCVLAGRMVYNFQRINTRNGGKWLIPATIDAAMIIAFAILEKGRW